MYVNPTSAGASYKREVFDKVGYFDEQFDVGEDYEFNYRVAQTGYRAYTSLQLALYYYPRKSLGALFKQMTRYRTGDGPTVTRQQISSITAVAIPLATNTPLITTTANLSRQRFVSLSSYHQMLLHHTTD